MKRLIFLVDDDPILRRAWAGLLEQALPEVEVVIFGEAGSALEQMAAEPPALLILDLILDGMGGISLLNELRGDLTLRQIPVIVASSLADVALGEAYGVVAVVDKARVRPEELVALVRRHLDERGVA